MVKYMDTYIKYNFDKQITGIIHTEAEAELVELKKNCVEESKKNRATLFKVILPTISLYHALQTQMSKQKAFEHMNKMISNNTKETSRKMYERISKLPNFFFLFKKMFVIGLSGEGWDVEWISNNKISLEFNVKRCIYNDAFRQYDCSELCALYCNNDHINFTDVTPKIRFERKGALGYGNDICDFHFYAMKKNNNI
ncbi:hypothetical protein AN1V17_43690 [Vallitalea sediminicola]